VSTNNRAACFRKHVCVQHHYFSYCYDDIYEFNIEFFEYLVLLSISQEKLLSDLEIATMENIYRRLESQDDNASVFQASEIDLLLKMLSSWPRSRISHG
jgi:hypothetical protein